MASHPTSNSLMEGGPVGSLDSPVNGVNGDRYTRTTADAVHGNATNGNGHNFNGNSTTDDVFSKLSATRPPPPSIVEDPDDGHNPSRPVTPRPETWPRTMLPGSPHGSTASQRHESHQVPVTGIHEGNTSNRSHARISTYAEEGKPEAQFPRISRPVELLRSSYDTVVIGSGYGGAVAASDIARTGESVCVLEMGKERWPGEYPTSCGEALKEVHYSGDFAPGHLPGKIVDGGNQTGMYHLIFGKGQNAIVCNGLGGTSLMNANVWLEADKETLQSRMWPEGIRNDPNSLDPYYKAARVAFDPRKYPEDWPKLRKLELLEQQAKYIGMSDKFRRVEQTTRFRNGPNHFGVEQSPSALTGQDGTGINDGSKTTTLVTYLADAWNWGAELFCECEVRHIEKVKDERGGYLVYFAWHGRNRGHFKANLHGDLMWVHAKKAVILGGGAIGTTEILLRSKALGLKMSNQVGKNMSGNGDMLAFGYNTDQQVNAMGRSNPSPYNPIGPCITGIIDNRAGHDNPLDGYVIQEGTIPHALAPLMQAMLHLMPGAQYDPDAGLVEKVGASLTRWGSRLLGPYFKQGAVERTQVYLVMSHDSNQAMLHLKDDKPVLEFLGVGRSHHVKHINSILYKATKAVGGTLVQNPFYALMGGQEVTVHPVGGACMARDGTPDTGVTNQYGEIFCEEAGDDTSTHSGLIVTDASVIPCALGANPIATITALAKRSMEAYCKQHDLNINQESNGLLNLFGEPRHQPQIKREKPEQEVDNILAERSSVDAAVRTMSKADIIRASGFGFTEVMSGFIHYDKQGLKRDVRSTYELAARTARSRCESARFFLSVQAFNTTTIIQDPSHRAMLTGTFVCPTIPGSPFMVSRGEFNLFKLDHKAPGTRNLTYDFDMKGTNGEELHFHGYKVVDSSVALGPRQFWRSTSTLYVTISSKEKIDYCHELDGEVSPDDAWRHLNVVARGLMHIKPSDFMQQLMTMTPTGSSIFRKVQSAASFLTFFTRKSMSLFLAPLTSLQYPSQTYSGYVNNTIPDHSYDIYASDKVCTKMHVWLPTHIPEGQEVKDLFMIPGASVDHQIFALPTIRYNAINYFTRAGYRVFVTVHRIGQLVIAENDWTTYDARLDIKACLEYIRKMNKAEHPDRPVPKIYTIAHCMGSVAYSCGLLDGTIPSSWIAGITCSQVFMNPIWNVANMIKVMGSPVPLERVYGLLGGSWFSCSTSKDDTLFQRCINQALRFWPDERKEICNNATCHRISLVYARCWNHRNLNEATHRQIDRFFGGVNMKLLHLLMRMGSRDEGVTGNAPLYEPLATRENIEKRLRGVPIMLFVGRDNAVLSPESTERTYEILTDTFGSSGGILPPPPPPPPPSPSAVGVNGAGVGAGRGAGAAHGTQRGADLAYRRRVVPGYGHLDCWMGRNAWKDVYPFVLEEVDRVVRGEGYRFKEPDDRFKRMVERGDLLY